MPPRNVAQHSHAGQENPAQNCRFDGSVGVYASLAAVMSSMRQLLHAWDVGGNLLDDEEL